VAIETPARRATSAIVGEWLLKVMIFLKALSENAFKVYKKF
jgi:hypothetical protein